MKPGLSKIKRMKRKYSIGVCPASVALEREISPYLKYINGKVLNAGSGNRKMSLGDECINVDIIPEYQPDVLADLNDILPFEDNSFDTVFSVACLEHVPRPWFTIKELYRVTKPNGYVILCIPFMQPFHAWPHDYTRFTSAGMESLLKEGKYSVIKVEANQEVSFGYTLSWLITEYYAKNKKQWFYMRFFFKPLFYLMKRGYIFGRTSANTESAYFGVGKKDA